jgi:hypothetical protein
MRGNRVLTNNATVCRIPTCGASDTAEIDPNRFTLRPVDALRAAYAQVMEELDLVKELLGAASDAQRASVHRVRVDACLWLTAPRVR